VVALLSVLVGVALFVGGIFTTVNSTVKTTFASGETANVSLDPADSPVIYLSSQGQVHYTCRIGGGPEQAKLVRAAGSADITVNNTRWQQILVINVPAKDDYQITCTTEEQTNARFGVGQDPATAAGGLLGGVAALVLIPGAGILVAVIVTIVIVIRRNNHRKRLSAGG
jgi:hypothetical protein